MVLEPCGKPGIIVTVSDAVEQVVAAAVVADQLSCVAASLGKL
jgi:hypothetical protein